MATESDRPTIASLIRAGVLDAELAALLWLLGEGGVPITVASADDATGRADVRAALDDLVPSSGPRPVAVSGGSLSEVLARSSRRSLPMLSGPAPREEPVATGIVLVLAEGRVTAGHYVRPPLRDAAGHVRRQGPAVLATRDEAGGRFDHFAWGIYPELAERTGQRAGDFEREHGERTEYLAALAASGVHGHDEVRRALHGYRHRAGVRHDH